jgi:aryl-alcohol dehydrogenase-like predicted oxidoreductase
MHIPRMSRTEIVSDLTDSLKSLQTELIDLYWLHRDDPQRPVEDILETMNDQVKAGKIRYFGCSNWRAARIEAAQAYATGHGLQGFAANQPLWSLALVDPAGIKDKTTAAMDEEMHRYHQETGLAAIPYSSQANGLFQRLAQGTREQMSKNAQEMYPAAENRRRFERVKQIAAENSLSVTQVVLGYLQSQPFPTIPIVGCRTLAQLQDSLTAAEVRLTPAQVTYLEKGIQV